MIVLLLVFVAGVAVFSHFRNREDTVEAVELNEALLPVLYMQDGDLLMNPMFGNKAQMDGTTMREHLTLLPTGRDLKVAAGRQTSDDHKRSLHGKEYFRYGDCGKFHDQEFYGRKRISDGRYPSGHADSDEPGVYS